MITYVSVSLSRIHDSLTYGDIGYSYSLYIVWASIHCEATEGLCPQVCPVRMLAASMGFHDMILK